MPNIWRNLKNMIQSLSNIDPKDASASKHASGSALLLSKVRSQKKTTLFGKFSQHGGGVFPNPKTFVNLPSIFLYAKFILRC